MNLEITIKVPLGAGGVTVNQNTDEAETASPPESSPPGLEPGPPPVESIPHDRLAPYLEGPGRFAPDNGERSEDRGSGQALQEPEGVAEMLPPALGELGVAEPTPADEVGPPSIESLLASVGPGLGQPTGPPTLEELGAEESPETPAMGPPHINGEPEIEVASQGTAKSSAPKASAKAKAPAKKRSKTTTTEAPTATDG